MGIAFPTIIYYTGILGFLKFWVMPWLGYHFWMSTFTVVHHTAPHIPFKDAKEWDAAQAQLSGTVHCDFPRWSVHWHLNRLLCMLLFPFPILSGTHVYALQRRKGLRSLVTSSGMMADLVQCRDLCLC